MHLYEAQRVLLKFTLGYQSLLLGCGVGRPEAEWINGLIFTERMLSSLSWVSSSHPPHPHLFHTLCKGYLISEVSMACWYIPLMATSELCHVSKFFPAIVSLLHLDWEKGCRSSWRRETRVAESSRDLCKSNQSHWMKEEPRPLAINKPKSEGKRKVGSGDLECGT